MNAKQAITTALREAETAGHFGAGALTAGQIDRMADFIERRGLATIASDGKAYLHGTTVPELLRVASTPQPAAAPPKPGPLPPNATDAAKLRHARQLDEHIASRMASTEQARSVPVDAAAAGARPPAPETAPPAAATDRQKIAWARAREARINAAEIERRNRR